MGKIQVVVDGQFGSCGKGAVASALIKRERKRLSESAPILAVRVAGPNAGHTVIGDKGTDTSESLVAPHLCKSIGSAHDTEGLVADRFAWALRCVPVAAVVDPGAILALGAGSEVDLDVLLDEIEWLDAAGYDVTDRFMVDEQVTIIGEEDRVAERVISTGTTGKGIGAARCRRLMRDPDACLATNAKARDRLDAAGIRVVTADEGGVAQIAHGLLRQSAPLVQIEGTQGFGLGLHSGYYPFTTSSNCRAIDFLAMTGINPWMVGSGYAGGPSRTQPELQVWVCLRPYPIRIAGNSGPLQNETTWEDLGLDPEITTVTRKTRRVGHWDRGLARRALAANGGPGGAVRVAFTMADQLLPQIRGFDELDLLSAGYETIAPLQRLLNRYTNEIGQPIDYLGTGPDSGLWPISGR